MFRSEAQTDSEELKYLAAVQCKEDRLKVIFAPIEKYLCAVESVLTWEYPIVFLLLLLFSNCLFWIYNITPFYCLISIGGFIALGVQFTINHVFPLFTDLDSSEEWIKVRASEDDNLDLLHCLAVLMTKFENIYKMLEFHKKDNRDRFNLLGILTCMFVMILSYAINESYLLYCFVMGALLWPGLKYNKISEIIFKVVKPYLDQFERKMRIKRTVSSKILGDGDDSDAELEQFIPAKETNESFPSLANEVADDSDTNEDFMPQVNGGESKDDTDDELFSEDLSLAAQDVRMNLDKTENIETLASDSENESIHDDVGISTKLDLPDDISMTKDSIREEDDENFAEGLSFNNDDGDGDDEEEEEEVVPKVSGQGGLQTKSGTFSGLMGRTISGVASLYRLMNSYIPSPVLPLTTRKEDGNDSVQTVDDEFDFLNQELEDMNDS